MGGGHFPDLVHIFKYQVAGLNYFFGVKHCMSYIVNDVKDVTF